MKCPACGKTIAKKVKVCKHCGVELLDGELVVVETDDVNETVNEPMVDEEVKQKAKLVSIKPETMEKAKDSLTNAFQYIFHTIAHPSAEKMPLDLTQVICVDGIISIVYILWLYILQRGVLEIIPIYDATGPARISSIATILGGIALALGMVVLVGFIVAINKFVKKEKLDIIGILQDTTHIILVPSMLLLLATIVAAFWFQIGVFLFCVTFVSLLMNIVLLFKDNNNYFSYIVVSVTIALMIFLIYYVLGYCVESWTIAGNRVGDMLQNLFPF